MLAYVNGDGQAKMRLETCYGQIAQLQEHLFAKIGENNG